MPVLNFLAWRKAIAIGNCLDAALAVLAAIASQALHRAACEPPSGLRSIFSQIRDVFPPVDEPRPLGNDCEQLAELFAPRVFS